MSKFVTYPAVTVLDDDQSLLIDSPSAGTNSITAENAGNTLLSKWAGFDTFDEAVQNTIENNQEFIDRDTAIREETAELKKKIVTTFPAKEASGAVATFESEFEDAPLKSCIVQVNPVQDLHGYDHPWPAGGGKNLLPYPYNGNTESKNGVTVTVNNDGTIVLNGTATSTNYLWLINRTETIPSWVRPSTEYAVSGGNGSFNSNAQIRMILYGSPSWTLTESHRSTPADLSAYTAFTVVVRMLEGSTYNNTKIYPQIELGSTATDYAPYSNECPISGFTGVEVHRTGKNLFNYDSSKATMGTTAAGAARAYYPLGFSNCTLSFSAELIDGENVTTSSINIGKLKDGKLTVLNGFITPSTITDRTFTFSEDEQAVLITASNSVNSITSNFPKYRICVVTGTTPTPYEPYQGQTYPITFPSEAGIVYGAYVDVINGELVVDRAMVDLGTLRWIYLSSPVVFYSDTVPGMKTTSDKDGKCSVYKKITGWVTDSEWTNGDKIFTLSGSDGRIRIKDTAYTDASAFKSAMNGVQFCYELAEPIHYTLTPQEIKTLLGTNNVWSNTGDVSVEYLMSDVGWYVEKKLRAFQSVLAGVEDSAVASKNYSTDSYLIFNDEIYRVTKTITAGETIEDGVNVTKTTVAEQLMALAQV